MEPERDQGIVKGTQRKRYIFFAVSSEEGTPDFNSFLQALRYACEVQFHKTLRDLHIRLIRYNGYTGIIQCSYIEKEQVIKLLQSLTTVDSKKIKVTPKVTSGTIRSLLSK
ncbi:MAG: Rpp14/Pop5 family protein [Candidatus Thermoplasmatota archaeon]